MPPLVLTLDLAAQCEFEIFSSVAFGRVAMTRMLDRHERKGLIVRIPDDQDQRQVRLALTSEGDAISSALLDSETL